MTLLFAVVVVALLVGAAWFFPRKAMAPRGRTLQIGARVALVWLAGAVLVVASLPAARRVLHTVSWQGTRWCWATSVIAAVAIVVVPLSSPVSPPRTPGEQYAAVVDRVQSALGSGAQERVALAGDGTIGASFEVPPGLGYGLVLDGDHIYLPALREGVEDVDFRKLSRAPSDAANVFIEKLPSGRRSALSHTSHGVLVGVVEGTSGAFFAVYLAG